MISWQLGKNYSSVKKNSSSENGSKVLFTLAITFEFSSVITNICCILKFVHEFKICRKTKKKDAYPISKLFGITPRP